MKLLRQTIRRLILETCKRPEYWGVAGAGIVLVCSEDSTIYLHKRHTGTWAYPGGGIHISNVGYSPLQVIGGNWRTPIPQSARLEPNDPRFKETAIVELEEEAGYKGIPHFTIIDELITYEDCGFLYKTFIADVSFEEKQRWKPQPHPSCAWEVKGDGWFHRDEWETKDLHMGFTPELISAIRRSLS
jgi:8-oxo-dGTP pyrophosphatase MutT (NUDIX family)